MTRLQICLAAFTVLLGRGVLAHSTQDGEMGFSGGLTVQDPPAGWPLSELGHQDRARAMAAAAAAPRESWQSTTWGAVQEPEPAESRGSVRWYSPTPAEPFAADQQQMASQGDGWFAPEDHPLRQGRVLAAHPDPHPPSAPPPAQHMYFSMSQDAVAAAGSETPQAWQPTNSRYKRKRVKAKQQQLQEQQQQQTQSDQEQAIQHQQHQQHEQQQLQQQQQQQIGQQQHQQQLEQQQQLQQQQQQQLIQQQHQQLELQNQQQLQEPQLQHEPPPIEVKKSKKNSKRVNKRRPPPAIQSQPPQQHVLSQVPEGGQGPDPTVSVGYSIGFAAGPESGERHNGDFYRGSVQNEVVHGEGAVSYTNTVLPASQEGLQPEQQSGVVSSSAINGRPIYVPPLQQTLQQTSSVTFGSPAPTAGYQALPTPQALIGGPQPAFNLVAVTPSPAPAGPFIISTTPSYSTHTIFGSGSAKSEFSLGPTHKPPKAVSAVLHINDGTDFAWQDVGNGVEVSAPITPNGLRGGYRDSIPIMEDTDDADPPAAPFEASTAAALQSGPPAYAHSQGAVFGESGRVESSEARPLLETPSNHLAEEPPSKPDPFRGFTSSSFIDFMRAYTSNTRQPHSGGRGPSGLGDSLLNTKLGQVYYIPNDTPGGDPIPAIIMPLSRLRELQAALPSGKKPVFDLPPAEAEQPHFGKAPSFAESPFKSSSFSDIPFKSSFDEPSNAFKSQSFSDAPFKFADSPFKTPSPSDSPFPAEAPFKSSFGGGDHRGPGGPPPSKYRPSFGKGPGKEVYFKHQRPGPPQLVSYKQQGPRFGGSSSGVKVTKSVAVYEDHQTVNNKQPQVSANEQNPTLQWPPKETVEVQTYLMPIEQFDGLKSSGPSLPPGHPGHHGPVRGQGPPSGPSHHREVRRPAGHRPMRAHQLHQQPPHHQQPHQQAQFHPAHHLPSQHESGAFAVTSSYRVRPSAG